MKYTPRQLEGLRVLKSPTRHVLFDGGSRSGKTTLLARWYGLRSLKYKKTRRLITRLSKQSCISTVWRQTLIPELHKMGKEGEMWEENKSDRIITFANGSQIWAGGFDNKVHEDAILGQEWADIWLNEATDATYQQRQRIASRLNWSPEYCRDTGFTGKFTLDCNPKGSGHWINLLFNKHLDPDTREKLPLDKINSMARLFFQPMDNEVNLAKEYIDDLRSFSGMARKRFWEGLWADQVDNAVYNFRRDINVIPDRIQYERGIETWASWDFGVNDDTAIIWYQIRQVPKNDTYPHGVEISIIDEYIDRNKSVEHYIQVCRDKHYGDVNHCGDPAGRNRNESLNSWVSKLRDAGIHVQVKHGHSIAELIDNGNRYIHEVRVNENQCPKVVEMFENWEYSVDSEGKAIEGKPQHDQYSHPGTSFYYFTANRFPIRKKSEVLIL